MTHLAAVLHIVIKERRRRPARFMAFRIQHTCSNYFAMADVNTIYNGKGQAIKWKYFVRLNEIQKNEGIHCANKLRDKRIHFENQK